MERYWVQFRNWAIEKLANGDPIALNVSTAGIFWQAHQKNGFFCNVHYRGHKDEPDLFTILPTSHDGEAKREALRGAGLTPGDHQ